MNTLLLTGTLISVLISLFNPTISFAETSAETLSQSAQIRHQSAETLSWSDSWRALLHYDEASGKYDENSGKNEQSKKIAKTQSHWVSLADDPQFFLSPDGKTNPQAELEAHVTGFLNPNISLKDLHPQCRFPARFFWLKQHISKLQQAPNVVCPQYQAWLSHITPKSISVIFPEPFMGSLSSLFGHIFFRVNSKQNTKQTRYLDYTVGYAAEIPPQGKEWLYIWKALTGGYPGYLTGAPYYEKIIRYNDIESRDIWEYELNLTQEETEQLVRHIWEMRQKKFDYFFFDENCAYRLLDMLKVIRPKENLTAHFSTHTIPADTVKTLFEHQFIATTAYRPSIGTQIKHQIKEHTNTQQKWIKKMSKGTIAPPFKEIATQTPQEQANILETSMKYLQFKQQKTPQKTKPSKKQKEYTERLNAIREASKQLPAPMQEKTPAPIGPENSHRSAKIDLSLGYRANTPVIGIETRPAFHDLTDSDHGFLKGAGIDFLKLNINIDKKRQIEIEKFTFAQVTSLLPRDAFFKPVSWFASTGFEQQRLYRDPWRFFLTGGSGVSYELTEKLDISLLMNLSVTPSGDFNQITSPEAGIQAYISYRFSPKLKLFATLERHSHEDDFRFFSTKTDLTFNYQLEPNHAIKWKASYLESNHFNEHFLAMAYAFYFN